MALAAAAAKAAATQAARTADTNAAPPSTSASASSPPSPKPSAVSASSRALRRVATLAAGVLIAGCGGHDSVTWTGSFESMRKKIDFYDITYSTTDVKILCSATLSGVHITITAPDGTKAQATQRDDGSQKSDITISGGRHDQQILTNGAIWKSVNGDIGCELEPDGSYDNVFYLHDGAAVCPGRHSS